MTSTASTDWPRAYLFQIHAEAVAHGLVFIEPISEADAKSLKQRLYRVRRRSDKSTAVFVPPEYHLVTVGDWQPGPDGTGRLPVIYNKLPGDKPLPNIRPANADEASAPMAPSVQPPDVPLTPEQFVANIEAADLTLKPDEIDSFVADLMKSAEARSDAE